MKFAALLAALTMAATFNMAYASEEEAIAYCNEQLEMEGIEGEEEKAEFLRECIASATSSENQ